MIREAAKKGALHHVMGGGEGKGCAVKEKITSFFYNG